MLLLTRPVWRRHIKKPPGDGLPKPVLLESFDAVAQFTGSGGATLAQDPVNKVQGTGAVSITADGTQAAVATKLNVANTDPATLGVIAVYTDNGNDPEYQTTTSVDVRLGRGGTYYGLSGVTNPSISDLNLGGFWNSYNVTDAGSLSTKGPGQLDLRVTQNNTAPRCGTTRVDAMYANASGIPTIVWTFDDLMIGQYNVAFPLWRSLGLKGTLYLAPSFLASGPPSHLTMAQVQEMYAAGWDMGCDGTWDDSNMTDHATVVDAVADINNIRQFLIDNGMPRAQDHMCYPFGACRVPGTKVQIAGVTSDGTNVVTVASTGGIVNGMRAAGILVPRSPAITVVNINSATQVTLSAAIPAGTSDMSFTNTSGEFHTGKLPAALRTAGFKTGRLTATGQRFTRFGLADQGLIFPGNSTNSTSFPNLAAFQARIDLIEKRGQTLMFYSHDIFPGGTGLHTDQGLFTQFSNELASRVAAGRIQVLTISELWARDGNATPP